jgi:dipeptidase D
MIASVWELAGYPSEISGAYSGWPPNPESPILALLQSTYQPVFGVEPEVAAVHAGLECGTFSSVYPGMDMISTGPSMQKVHSPSESLYIPSVEKVMRLLEATLGAIPEK